MCGLTGFLQRYPGDEPGDPKAVLREMTQMLVHRGPDDYGEWLDVHAGIALGFRRLSIVDLSAAGHQPMESAPGRYMMAYNGEVYNAEAIRQELLAQNLAPAFRGHSDTEVMLAAFEAWGVESAVKKFIGMFSIALWDREERALRLIRDRLGVKPLYYGWAKQTFLFGSELKALRAHPDFCAEVNRDALALYMRHNYVPAPHTIYEKFYKLTPGSILTLRARQENLPAPVPYWSAREAAEQGIANPLAGSETETLDQLDALLRDAVRLRMVADVPLGVFLSGGVDSSIVTALMQAQSARPVKTFTIGFHEGEFNEANYAKEVARHLGTDHTELYVRPEEALAVIPKLPTLYDEPFSDASQIPTYLVSELARRQVTVSLSGDGGDELFAGYNRYFWGRSIWKRIGGIPLPLRHIAAKMLMGPPPAAWDGLFGVIRPLLPKRARINNVSDKLTKLAGALAMATPDALYEGIISHEQNPSRVVLNSKEPPTVLADRDLSRSLPDFTQRMMYYDTMMYLPDDILVKVDRASMGVSLEAREPLLDHRLLEFAWRLPMDMKIRNGQGKWALRQILYRYVPEALIERPKTGFGVPIGAWLRGPLRDWAESLMEERRLRDEGYFQPEPIRKIWQEHLSGAYNWQYYIWEVLMFQAWIEANRGLPQSSRELACA